MSNLDFRNIDRLLDDFEPGKCVNCGGFDVTVQHPLYCSSLCRQMAEVVRYVRAYRADGRYQLPDVAKPSRPGWPWCWGAGIPNASAKSPGDPQGGVPAGGRYMPAMRPCARLRPDHRGP